MIENTNTFDICQLRGIVLFWNMRLLDRQFILELISYLNPFSLEFLFAEVEEDFPDATAFAAAKSFAVIFTPSSS